MTVTAAPSFNNPVGNGVSTVFAYGFKILQASDLKVTVDGVIVTNYTVAGVRNPAGGTIAFSVAPANLAAIRIARNMPLSRATDYQFNGQLPADTLNDDQDAPVMMVQQLDEKVQRSLRAPETEVPLNDLPASATRANRLLAFDANGQPQAVSSVAGTAVQLAIDLLASAGSSLVGFIASGTGAVARTVQAKLRDAVHVEDFGAVGNGVADDTTAFVNAAARGRTILLRDGANYLISSRITAVTGTRFVCPGGIAQITFKTGAGGFNGTDLTVSKDGSGVCGFLFSAVDDVGMEGIRFTTDGVASRVIYPIRCNGGTATKGCRFERLEFVGFAVCNGGLLALNTIGAGGYFVRDVVARSCGTALTTWTGTPQITVFEIDNDMLASVPSLPGYAENIRGIDVALTGAALALYGAQTDVVNIAGISGTDRKGPTIVGVYGDNVGEVVDLFCSHAIVKGVRGRNVYNFVVKLVHGAQYNDVEVESVESVGVAAVGIFGSASLAIHTQYNNVRIGSCRITTDIGAAGKANVVLFGDNGGTVGTCLPRNNVVRVENVQGDTAALDYVVRDGGAANSNANFVEVVRFTGTWAVNFCDCPPSNVRVRYRQNTRSRMTVGANQTLTTGIAATIQYQTTDVDTDGGADTVNFRVRCRFPGPKLVKGQIRLAATLNANDDVIVRILKNGVPLAQATHEPNGGSIEYSFAVDRVVDIVEDECGKATADLTIQATVTSAGTITVLNTATMSYFEVTDLG